MKAQFGDGFGAGASTEKTAGHRIAGDDILGAQWIERDNITFDDDFLSVQGFD